MQLALFSQPFPLIQQSGMVGYRITRINPFRIRLQQGQLRFVSHKWKFSEPVRYMNCLHDQKSLHVFF